MVIERERDCVRQGEAVMVGARVNLNEWERGRGWERGGRVKRDV